MLPPCGSNETALENDARRMDVTNRTNADSGFRRAFPLESRAVWMEQSHILFTDDLFVLPKDNLEVGPGRYSPEKLQRHINTPRLGASRSSLTVNSRYDFGSHGFTPSASISSYSIADDIYAAGKVDTEGKSEFSTIFHDGDRRQPLDPQRRYCKTPGPHVAQQTPLKFMSIDGKRSPRIVRFGTSERFGKAKDRLCYDVKYDSEQLRPRVTQGFTPGEMRSPTFLGPLALRQIADNDVTHEETCSRWSQHIKERRPITNSEKCFLVKVPKPKPKNALPEITFDSSCYTNVKKELVLDLYPGRINQLVRSNTFGRIVKLPKYKSHEDDET